MMKTPTHNVNTLHKAEQAASGLNTRIAVALTKSVGSMWTTYSFVLLAIVGLLGILGVLSPLVALLVAWTSQTLIQLVLLPVIMVGQNVLGRHAELMAEQTYADTEAEKATLAAIQTEQKAQRTLLEQLIARPS
jgi:hypothetical protein